MKCNKTDCEHFEKPVTFPDCMLCIHRIMSKEHYKPKLDPLRNLFDGAPVMVRDNCIKGWRPRYYKAGNKCYIYGKSSFFNTKFCYCEEIRLPTIEESPRNEWLAVPCDRETQIELGKLNLLIWFKNSKFPVRKIETLLGTILEADWEAVKKVMILDDE